MKLLIVDDENHVIVAIRMLISSAHFGFTQILAAHSYAEAKEIIERERPDILIVDIILKDKTGIDLLNHVQRLSPSTQVIAISGHSNYEYVRTMLLSGAVDYLLKPIEPAALFKALQKAISRLMSSAAPAADESAAGQMSEFLRETLYSMLFPNSMEAARKKIEKLRGGPVNLRGSSLLYYDCAYLPMQNRSFACRLKTYEKRLSALLADQGLGYFLGGFNAAGVNLIIVTDAGLEEVRRLTLDAFSSFFFTPHMGCTRAVDFFTGFNAAYAHARDCFLGTDNRLASDLFCETPYRAPDPEELLGMDLADQMLSCMIIEDEAALIALAQRQLDALSITDRAPLGLIRAMLDRYAHIRQYWQERINAFFPDTPFQFTPSLLCYASFLNGSCVFSAALMSEQLLLDLRALYSELCAYWKRVDLFQQISFYIQFNYYKPLNQNDYAQLFHINKDYLSRRFKMIYRDGMVAYINNLRIRKAEQLLSNSSLRIREIAYQTGFNDEKYFTKQFKAAMKVTPSEYRMLLSPKDGQP